MIYRYILKSDLLKTIKLKSDLFKISLTLKTDILKLSIS